MEPSSEEPREEDETPDRDISTAPEGEPLDTEAVTTAPGASSYLDTSSTRVHERLARLKATVPTILENHA